MSFFLQIKKKKKLIMSFSHHRNRIRYHKIYNPHTLIYELLLELDSDG
jgi:hypothetical protein